MKIWRTRREQSTAIRNLTFGVQDSFGSTLGFLSGVWIGGMDRETIIFSATILIFVEAMSMAIGSLVSEHAVEEFKQKKELPITKSLTGPFIMLVSYIAGGFIPLLPFIFLWGRYSLLISVFVTLFALAVFSYVNAKRYKIRVSHYISEALLVGGLSIIIGIVVGLLFPY